MRFNWRVGVLSMRRIQITFLVPTLCLIIYYSALSVSVLPVALAAFLRNDSFFPWWLLKKFHMHEWPTNVRHFNGHYLGWLKSCQQPGWEGHNLVLKYLGVSSSSIAIFHHWSALFEEACKWNSLWTRVETPVKQILQSTFRAARSNVESVTEGMANYSNDVSFVLRS